MKRLKPLIEDALVWYRNGTLAVTPEGRLFLRNIARCFEAYAIDFHQQTPVYSRTV